MRKAMQFVFETSKAGFILVRPEGRAYWTEYVVFPDGKKEVMEDHMRHHDVERALDAARRLGYKITKAVAAV